MAQIQVLSPHVANLIAAGEVVERPASVAKELLENAVDAGATQVTLEIRDGGMTFLRVTDNGCGMTAEDARVAFRRHATSKLRTAEDLAAIETLGFRGEALAAIASVSRIELLTKTPGALEGFSLSLEAGTVTAESEAGCPQGTTVVVRDLFFNTPARMKFMKSDPVEAGRITAAVQLQALAHPQVAFSFLRDGKSVLRTPGTGKLRDVLLSIYGKNFSDPVAVDSQWEGYRLTGFVTKPTDARPSRAMQTFFVNDRPVQSRLLTAALEEAYRNRLLQGKFPGCVLHLHLSPAAVDVNVHPAKTEIKFLSEKAAFDCVHYGVLAALNKAPDRPEFKAPVRPAAPAQAAPPPPPAKGEPFYRTMNPQEFKAYTQAMAQAPKAQAYREKTLLTLRQEPAAPAPAKASPAATVPPAKVPPAVKAPEPPQPEQVSLPMPAAPAWRLVGELYRSYVLVEQGDEAFLIDKHAAHERILFDRLRENPEAITAQSLLTPLPLRLSPEATGELLANQPLLESLGFSLGQLGPNTLALRQVPMDLSPEDAAEALEALAQELGSGKTADPAAIRDEALHTVACKAAIKAGWNTSQQELLALVTQVMAREDLKYCPHGRPICISLSKKQLEKQFRR